MVKFLEDGESIKAMDGVDEVGFLLINEGIHSSNVFEMTVCLMGVIDC